MPKKFIPSLCERSTAQGYSSAESDLEQIHADEDLRSRGRSKKKQSLHYPRPHSHLFRDRFGGRVRGGRHARRQDNSIYLTRLYQIDEDEDYSSVIPEHNTPFTRLFTNNEEQKLWETFDSLSEEKQDSILSTMHHLGNVDEKTQKGQAELKLLDPHLKKVLLHTKRIPKGFMNSLEEDFREFFSDDHMGVLVLMQLTSFQRMLVHGISQYNGLTSQRFELNHDVYLVITKEKENNFKPPLQLLSSFLK